MARRSPLNPRYQKNTGPAGKTRRSSSAMKPKREVGASTSSGGAKKPAPKRGQAINRDVSPEMRLWQRVNYGLMALVIIGAAGYWFFAQQLHNRGLAQASLALEVTAAIVSIWVIFGPSRRARNEWQNEGKKPEKKSDRGKGE